MWTSRGLTADKIDIGLAVNKNKSIILSSLSVTIFLCNKDYTSQNACKRNENEH